MKILSVLAAAALCSLTVAVAAAAIFVVLTSGSGLPLSAQSASIAPYVPTAPDVVVRMLELAGVTSSDVVYDLGCGDGRIVIEAAARFGARGVGVDIDPVRIAESVANAELAGVSHLVRFVEQDAMTVDVSEATVVTLYLFASSNERLLPRLTAQLRPAARIVAHEFSLGVWPPHVVERFVDESGMGLVLYLWRHDGTRRP